MTAGPYAWTLPAALILCSMAVVAYTVLAIFAKQSSGLNPPTRIQLASIFAVSSVADFAQQIYCRIKDADDQSEGA